MTTMWHLKASALHDHHVTGALPAPGGGGLDWGIRHATVQILFTVDLTFCSINVIDHFMCDFYSLLEFPAVTPTGLDWWWQLTLGA